MAAAKIPMTRPELKRRRDGLALFERYLPVLELKRRQLQLVVRGIERRHREIAAAAAAAREKFERYGAVLADRAGVNVKALAAAAEVATAARNVAGVTIPVFEGVAFPEARYSLFATPPWVDAALADLREISRHEAELAVVAEQERRIRRELVKVTQRVNLFEKVKIPEAREAIRRIRIHLGDEMAAAVGRAKLAKAKLSAERRLPAPAEAGAASEPGRNGAAPAEEREP